jgi:hypothetical protein
MLPRLIRPGTSAVVILRRLVAVIRAERRIPLPRTAVVGVVDANRKATAEVG